MAMKGWAEAHRHKGGILRYLYDKIKELDGSSGGASYDDTKVKKDIKDNADAITALEARVEALENA